MAAEAAEEVVVGEAEAVVVAKTGLAAAVAAAEAAVGEAEERAAA